MAQQGSKAARVQRARQAFKAWRERREVPAQTEPTASQVRRVQLAILAWSVLPVTLAVLVLPAPRVALVVPGLLALLVGLALPELPEAQEPQAQRELWELREHLVQTGCPAPLEAPARLDLPGEREAWGRLVERVRQAELEAAVQRARRARKE